MDLPTIPLTRITAEIDREINGSRDDAEQHGLDFGMDWQTQARIVDIVAGVLARYKGQVIVDHEAFVTQPSPRRERGCP